LTAFFLSERGKFAEGVDDRTLIRGDGVGTVLECGGEMLHGGLAGVRIERASFKENIGLGALQPFVDISGENGDIREMIAERGDGIEAIGVGDPSNAAGGDASETPAHVEFPAQLGFFGDELAEEGAAYMSETDNSEVIGGNGGFPFWGGLLSGAGQFFCREKLAGPAERDRPLHF
jgi:hypothetical protein